jgi:hypothetical protein
MNGEIDLLSLVSEKNEIDKIEEICTTRKATIMTQEFAQAMAELGDSLLQDSLYNAAFYFYFEAIYCCTALKLLRSELLRRPLLQVAKMVRCNRVRIENTSCNAQLAKEAFGFLIEVFECEEAMTYRFID